MNSTPFGSNTRVRAVVRVRPMPTHPHSSEQQMSHTCVTPANGATLASTALPPGECESESESLSVLDPVCFHAGVRADVLRTGAWSRDFTFDRCLWSNVDSAHPLFATQEDLYREVGAPVIDWVATGFNCCVFAFGQTGSGKTCVYICVCMYLCNMCV